MIKRLIEMKWYILAVVLLVYPIGELSRLIYGYWKQYGGNDLVVEFIFIWVCWFTAWVIIIKNWR